MAKWFGAVYVLTNTVTGMQYVGKTERCTRDDKDLPRWEQHIDASQCRAPKTSIHRAIKKYGASKFTAEVVRHCRFKHTLNAAEKYWIKKLNTVTPNGYNLTAGGDGVEFTTDIRARMSASAKARFKTPEGVAHQQRMCSSARVALASAEVRVKHVATMRSPEMRAKMAERTKAFFATHPEARVRIAAQQRAIALTPEGSKRLKTAALKLWRDNRERMMKMRKAMFASEEFIEKLRSASARRWARPEERAHMAMVQKKRFEDLEERKKISTATKRAMVRPEVRAKYLANRHGVVTAT